PGGSGYSDDKFSDVGNYGYWWSSSENDSDDAYFRDMNYNNEFAYWFSISKAGLFSVRCVKD
ncbi:MAG: hypothetical protein FWC26_06275, partial [Fibromonadales bacterium]|nr:hypothetical protein [Fibromonadales bacterium]